MLRIGNTSQALKEFKHHYVGPMKVAYLLTAEFDINYILVVVPAACGLTEAAAVGWPVARLSQNSKSSDFLGYHSDDRI